MFGTSARVRLSGVLGTVVAGAVFVCVGSQAGAADNWGIGGAVGYEYEDNVRADAVQASASDGDSAAVFDAFAWADLLDDDFGRLRARYDVYASERSDLSDYDLLLHIPSLAFETETGDVESGITDWELRYRYTDTTLGDQRLYRSHAVSPSIGRLVGDSVYVSATAEYEWRDFVKAHDISLTTPNDRDSQRVSIGGSAIWILPGEAGIVRSSYALLYQNAASQAFDYVSNEVEAAVLFYIPAFAIPLSDSHPEDPGSIEFVYGYDRRDYSEVSGFARDDRLHELRAGVGFPIGNHIRASIEFQRFDARSDLATADYVSNVVSTRVGVAF